MTKPNKTEMLTAIVQAALDGGYEFLYEPTGNELDYLTIYLNSHDDSEVTEPVEINLTDTIADDVTGSYMSLPDFILSAPAMNAVYGEDTVCPDCGINRKTYRGNQMGRLEYAWCGTIDCAHYVKVTPAWQYYSKKACDIIISGGCPVEYLYNEMIKLKGEKNV